MRADLIHAPDLTDEEQEALTPAELDVWLAAAARFNLRLECEWLWARRQPCSACGAPATWHYDPAEGTPESRWRCDTCIHRGCSCMASAAYDAANSDVPQSEADLPPFDPERDGLRLADGRLSPCMEWHAFTDPATLPAVGDLAGWAARATAGLVP